MTGVNTKLGSVPDISAASAASNSAAKPFPWPAAAATGIGSVPGTSPAEAIAVILGELPDFPHLPELPARGPGSDLAGRTAALLVDMPVETSPRGWRFALRPGRDQRHAAGLLAEDLDAVQQAAEGYAGPFKIQVAGPWTLAAAVELSRSQDPALADPGAVADLIASLAEGVAGHVAEVRQRIPAATVVLQLDEPALPAVLAGGVPTASGLNRVGAVDTTVTGDGLRAVLTAAAAFSVVHCCAPDYPFQLIKDSGAGAISIDISQLPRGAEDDLAELAEAGLGILAGALDTKDAERMSAAASPAPKELAGSVIELWHRTGLPRARLAEQVVITPACGLAGFSAAGARAALASCRDAARILPELLAEGSP
jgi:methionine synthase II (cobalamin-independent)